MANDLAIRILDGMERLALENSALKSYLNTFHPGSPWKAHVDMMLESPVANDVVRQRFLEVRCQLETADDLLAALREVLQVFPASKEVN